MAEINNQESKMVESTMIETIMKLHKCEDCPIRCNAIKKPHSIFARIHRWHRTWWPGWQIYLRDLHTSSARATAAD